MTEKLVQPGMFYVSWRGVTKRGKYHEKTAQNLAWSMLATKIVFFHVFSSFF